jgi:hypothetical protein
MSLRSRLNVNWPTRWSKRTWRNFSFDALYLAMDDRLLAFCTLPDGGVISFIVLSIIPNARSIHPTGELYSNT